MNTSRTTLITGAASGIGAATAARLAAKGDTLLCVDRDERALDALLRQLHGAGHSADAVIADLADRDQADAAISAALRHHDGVDVLVSCAGITRRNSITNTSDDEWDEVIAINLTAGFRTARQVIPHMITRGGGAVVFVASIWGMVAGPQVVAYAAAKGGLINLARAMAIDHGPDGIRVNAVCPGDVDTPLMRQEMLLVGDDPTTAIPASAQARPLGRVGTPADVAAAIDYLASPDAAYITGSTLVLDGGWHAGG